LPVTGARFFHRANISRDTRGFQRVQHVSGVAIVFRRIPAGRNSRVVQRRVVRRAASEDNLCSHTGKLRAFKCLRHTQLCGHRNNHTVSQSYRFLERMGMDANPLKSTCNWNKRIQGRASPCSLRSQLSKDAHATQKHVPRVFVPISLSALFSRQLCA
jgi:hypothetical protein